MEEKRHFGDFEIDTIIGRNHKGAIMTTNGQIRLYSPKGTDFCSVLYF